ncbi:hypothetical protein L218DRAFT_907197, partial [Marasmius fiardii PR-910]
MPNDTPPEPYRDILSFQKLYEVAYETKGRYLGPVPTKEFLEATGTIGLKDRSLPSGALNGWLIWVKEKKDMCIQFVGALESWPPSRDEDMRVKLVYHNNHGHSYGDPNCCGLAVDVAVSDTRTRGFWRDGEEVFFAEHESYTKFKSSVTSDPFVDSEEAVGVAGEEVDENEEEEERQEEEEQVLIDDLDVPSFSALVQNPGDDHDECAESISFPASGWENFRFENPSRNGISCRGQLAHHAAAVMTVQYCTHFFQLVIFGSFARMLRWDRSCALVLERFNYKGKPQVIFDFYKRLAQLGSADRGYDPRISRATKAEAKLARDAFR